MDDVFKKVSIIGAGCCKFGENFHQSRYDLVIDAVYEALEDAKLELKDIQAVWVSTQHEMGGASVVSDALKLGHIPWQTPQDIAASIPPSAAWSPSQHQPDNCWWPGLCSFWILCLRDLSG